MKIQYCSDLHIEFGQNAAFLDRNPIKPVGEVLVIAGDLTNVNLECFKDRFFDYLSEKFPVVYIVPGNHEFYHGPDTSILDAPLNRKIRNNVFLVDNTIINYKNVNFIFTTLWSRIGPNHSAIIQKDLNDFRLIKHHGHILTIDNFNELFNQSFNFLQKVVSGMRDSKTVVVTHHVPTYLCNTAEYKNDPLNEAFIVELRDFIFKNKINYWIYGHSHKNVKPVTINKTVLLTNQLGYVMLTGHNNFKADACFEI
jgi:Icc-related predicted phosphoesterase